MEKYDKIKLRLLEVAKNKGISYEKFFRSFSTSYDNFKGKSLKSSLRSIVLVDFSAKYPDIDLRWLITGKKRIEDCQESQTLKVEEETEDYINYKDKYLKLLEQNMQLRDKVDELKEKKECNTIATNTINK